MEPAQPATNTLLQRSPNVDNRIVALVIFLVLSVTINIGLLVMLFIPKITKETTTNNQQSAVQETRVTPSEISPSLAPTQTEISHDYSNCFSEPESYSGGGISIPNVNISGFAEECPVYVFPEDNNPQGQISKHNNQYLIFTQNALYTIHRSEPTYDYEPVPLDDTGAVSYSKTFLTEQKVPIIVNDILTEAQVTLFTNCTDKFESACDKNSKYPQYGLLIHLKEGLWLELVGSNIITYVTSPDQWETSKIRINKYLPTPTATSTPTAP